MSSPSTPTRSSRATSAASTPSMRASKSPIELTPRSKVKAMLAAAGMSDDSDEGNAINPSRSTTRPAETAPRPAAPTPAMNPSNDAASTDSEDDDDIPPRKPVGRMAARMLAQGSESAKSRDEDGGPNAYERVKKMLMAGKDKPQDTSRRSSPAADAESSSGGDLTVRSAANRRLTRKALATPNSATSASRKSSPGLFMSPSLSSPTSKMGAGRDGGSGSDSDFPDSNSKSRLQELVARKRAERKAKEETEKKHREESRRKSKVAAAKSRRIDRELNGSESDSGDDEGIAKKLTQQSRPTRKASKKAIEEMNRETQRMERNMQLGHQARTKKKFTTNGLLARFNYGQAKGSAGNAQQNNPSGPVNSLAASSDVELREKETPPTSPPSTDNPQQKTAQNQDLDANGFPVDSVVDIGQDIPSDSELPDLEDIFSRPVKRIDKGKGRAVEPTEKLATQPAVPAPAPEKKTRAYRVVVPKKPADPISDSDDDLEIIKDARFSVFDNVPARKAREPHAILALRHLAHLTSPSKTRQKGDSSMNPAELALQLQRRAREQAKAEKEEKIAELRAKGIFVQTEEEREKDQLELENLLEKARKEGEELAKKEKDEAKKEGKEGAEGDFPDSEDDDSYVDDAEDVEEEQELELSGSEDEGDEDEVMEDADGLIDNEAGEEEDEEEPEGEEPPADESEHEDAPTPVRRAATLRNRKRVVDDDEEDGDTNAAEPQSEPVPSQDETLAAFGFAPAAAPMGLSQMFAGTMPETDSQAGNVGAAFDSQQDSLDFLRNIPISTIPEFEATVADDDSQDFVIRDSQPPASQMEKAGDDINIGLSQFPSEGDYPDTQMSDMPDPTQDGGFATSRTPARLQSKTPAPSSTNGTVDTVILREPESPIMQRKKGRLQRRSDAMLILSDIDEDEAGQAEADSDAPASEEEDFEISANAFNIMRKGAKKKAKVDAFDKKKSAAKDMVQEQAEESEDEYAGIGGASDDESGGEMDEELKQMIDERDVKVDERQIAAFHAENERADDEKHIDKLYKDITNGGLRRKRGGEFDLSDSDDDAAERRRIKQREFARMRKALLEDEKIGKIAENPKRLAFLRSIEDHDDEEDFDFLDTPEESQSQSLTDSQEQQKPATESNESDAQATANALVITTNPLKRKAAFLPENDENRPPARPRRTAAPTSTLRRPETLAEIRESVSFLIDEPLVKETQLSASEDEDEDDQAAQSRAPFNEHRTTRTVVDRLSFSRSCSNKTNSLDAGNRDQPLAFAPASKQTPGFRVPLLLRRATTNMSTTSTTSATGSTTYSRDSGGAGTGDAGVRRGGSKKSNIHYQAREAERKRVVEASEQRRKEGLRKKVATERGRSVLGVLGSGEFE